MLYLIFDAYSCNRAQCSREEDNPLQSVFTIQHQLDLQMRYKTNFGTFSETEIEHRRTHIWGNKTFHTLMFRTFKDDQKTGSPLNYHIIMCFVSLSF